MRVIQEDQNLLRLQDGQLLSYIVGIPLLLVGSIAVFNPDFFVEKPSLWMGLGGIVSGILVIILSKTTTVSLDKTSNKLSILQKGLTGQAIKEYNLDQIKEIEMSASYSSSDRVGGYSYNLYFVLKNDESVPVNSGRSTMLRFFGKQIIPEKKLGEKIATFLNILFKEKKPLTMRETLSEASSAVQKAAQKEIEKQNKIGK